MSVDLKPYPAMKDGARRGPTRDERAAGHLSVRPPRAAVAGL